MFAEPDDSLAAGGFRLIVAIADVAHYVRPGSALDHAARTRGNSVYFPDRVVPMLPEALSNGWCSLRPDEDRGCLFVELRIDAGGRKPAHRFGRGLMRSAARLTYRQVQQMHDSARRSAPLWGKVGEGVEPPQPAQPVPPPQPSPSGGGSPIRSPCPPSMPRSAPCSRPARRAARSISTCRNAR